MKIFEVTRLVFLCTVFITYSQLINSPTLSVFSNEPHNILRKMMKQEKKREKSIKDFIHKIWWFRRG